MANISDIKKQLGYAGKNYGKTTQGNCYTERGVVRIGVYTSADSFHVEHINGVKTDIKTELDNISGAVQHALKQDSALAEKVFR